MNKLENIYIKNPIWLFDMDTAQDEDDPNWDITFFFKAYHIVYDKFPVVRKNKNIYDSLDILEFYNDEKLEDNLSNLNIIIANSLTDLIVNSYININKKISIADKNNIQAFFEIAFQKKDIPKRIKKEYITVRKFCRENKLNENKFKNILIKNNYYNNNINFMPSRKAMDKDKVFITNYFMPDFFYTKKIDAKYTGNFYILWEYQFLRNMMLKYYKKCNKDDYLYYYRYRRPKIYYTLIKRINDLINLFSSFELDIENNDQDNQYSYFYWKEISENFYIDFLFLYKSGKFLKYCDFKKIELEVNNILEKNIKKIENLEFKKILSDLLITFNKYSKHYKETYNQENNILPKNPNHPNLKINSLGEKYYSYD